MLGACPQIMAVLGSLILYALGKYLGVWRAGNPRRDLRGGELILNNFLGELMDSFPSQPAHNHHRGCTKRVWTGSPVHNPRLCVCA